MEGNAEASRPTRVERTRVERGTYTNANSQQSQGSQQPDTLQFQREYFQTRNTGISCCRFLRENTLQIYLK